MRARNGDVELAWEQVGTGEPLLLIQGLGYARWGWSPLVSGLAGRYRVITFDNRGIGESSVPPGPYTASQMAADAVAVLDSADVGRAHVIGTSLGGMIAQELATHSGDRVERLGLLSTTPGGPDSHPMPQVTVDLLSEAATLEPTVALRRFVENALGETNEQLVDQILALRLANPQDPAGWAAQAHAGTTYDGGGVLDTIGSPTLVMTGTADRVVDPRNSELLERGIPNATLRLVEGGGHLFFWERPEETVEALVEFLQ